MLEIVINKAGKNCAVSDRPSTNFLLDPISNRECWTFQVEVTKSKFREDPVLHSLVSFFRLVLFELLRHLPVSRAHIVFLCLPACMKMCPEYSGLLLASWSKTQPIIFPFHHNKPLFTNFAACSPASLRPHAMGHVLMLVYRPTPMGLWTWRQRPWPSCLLYIYPVSHTISGK